jgi:BACON domain-containing protein
MHPKRNALRQLAAALTAGLAAAATGCTTTQTSTTAPSADRCAVSVNATPTSFGAGGGAGSLTIVTARDCTWSASADATWVSIGGEKTGQGEATLSYSVAPNPVPSSRSSSIVVASQRAALTQAAAPCTFTLSRTADTVAAAGGALTVQVATLAGCHWTAATSDTWIRIASGGTGDATGIVGLAVSANAGDARVGHVNIGGQTYTVNQNAAPPPAPAPPPPPAPTPTPPPAPTPPPSPPPSPSPTPPPAPTPTPPPPTGGQQATFSGKVTDVSGSCPTLTFSAGGRTVKTTRDTRFSGISCKDVAGGGKKVEGDGITDTSGAIVASTVRKAG